MAEIPALDAAVTRFTACLEAVGVDAPEAAFHAARVAGHRACDDSCPPPSLADARDRCDAFFSKLLGTRRLLAREALDGAARRAAARARRGARNVSSTGGPLVPKDP